MPENLGITLLLVFIKAQKQEQDRCTTEQSTTALIKALLYKQNKAVQC